MGREPLHNGNAEHFRNTSLISLELLDLVIDADNEDTNSVKYRIRLDDSMTISADSAGNVTEGWSPTAGKLNGATLFIDLVESDDTSEAKLTSEQKAMSLKHQMHSGAIGALYRRRVESKPDELV